MEWNFPIISRRGLHVNVSHVAALTKYRALHLKSIEDPEGFWGEAAEGIDWIRKPRQTLDPAVRPMPSWFPDASLNSCYNAIDRHIIAGKGQETALIYESAVPGEGRQFTYEQLLGEVAAFAGGLQSLGVEKGDRVLIHMPMVPEAVIAMLACARIGAVHCVVFGGIGTAELLTCLNEATPKVIVTSSCGRGRDGLISYQPILDDVLAKADHKPDYTVYLQQAELPAELGANDIDWHALIQPGVSEPAGCATVQATDPLYIIFTSGTTGEPKGLVRDNGGHAVALNWAIRNIFNIGAGDVFWSDSELGWVVGHSFAVYAPLFAGAATVLYDATPFDADNVEDLWRVAAEHQVSAMVTSPTRIRSLIRDDPDHLKPREYDLSAITAVFVAGERLDPATYQWLHNALDIPVIDHWWQTESGWPIAANLQGIAPLPIKPGSPSVPVPGFDVHILAPDSTELEPGEEGLICLRLPLPPGAATTMYRDSTSFTATYLSAYEGYFLTGDSGYLDEEGYLYVLGRTEDIINAQGRRIAGGRLEAMINDHPDIAECAVIDFQKDAETRCPQVFLVLKKYRTVDVELLKLALMQQLESSTGAEFTPRAFHLVGKLPKTRTGKILRKTIRGILAGDENKIPGTIADVTVLEELRPLLEDIRSGKLTD